jgi:hypothetical protein
MAGSAWRVCFAVPPSREPAAAIRAAERLLPQLRLTTPGKLAAAAAQTPSLPR